MSIISILESNEQIKLANMLNTFLKINSEVYHVQLWRQAALLQVAATPDASHQPSCQMSIGQITKQRLPGSKSQSRVTECKVEGWIVKQM